MKIIQWARNAWMLLVTFFLVITGQIDYMEFEEERRRGEPQSNGGRVPLHPWII